MVEQLRPTLVFCLEELSAKAFLETFLFRAFPSIEKVDVRFIVFEGKRDLDRKLERRLRFWQLPNSAFVVLRDQDSADCRIVKKKIVKSCSDAGKQSTLVRIACRELESWYLGDLRAVDNALGTSSLSKLQKKVMFRTPDSLGSPSRELDLITKGKYQKVGGSREIGKHLTIAGGLNYSLSFQFFMSGVAEILQTLIATGHPEIDT